MKNRMRMLLGAGLGAAAMYYLDPSRGRYRRALARDQLVRVGHETRDGLGVVARDVRNRTLGRTAMFRSVLGGRQADDGVLEDRVRSAIGRVVSHPSSIEVEAEDGHITLSGPVLAAEVPELLHCARHVRGVRSLENQLEVHETAGRVPGLQGDPPPRNGRRGTFTQETWSPTARALGSLAGGAVLYYGMARRRPGGALFSTVGLALISRAMTNVDLGRLIGVADGGYMVDVQKGIRINAPVERIYALWSQFERFPSLTSHVQRVRRVEDRDGRERWRWTVRAPHGIEADFDSIVTAREENRLVAWQTEGGTVEHTGTVRFHPRDDGSTTVEVKLRYQPPGGALGHAFARLVGADPKHQLDDDLLRIKTYLETGKPPHDAATPLPRTASSGEEWTSVH